MTQEQYVSYKVAKLLNKKGFQINPNVDYWKIDPDGNMYFMPSIGAYTSDKNNKTAYYRPANSYPCPTQQMAMRWLREEHKILIVLIPSVLGNDTLKWLTSIRTYNQNECFLEEQGIIGKFDSYEEACEIAIKSALKDLIR